MLSNGYHEVMGELMDFMERHSLTREQMKELYAIFDKALKTGYMDACGDIESLLNKSEPKN